MLESPVPEAPCPRTLAGMEIHELLELIEVHGRAPGGEHSGPVATIASALVQRLGVQCERYRALIVARTSTSEWRFLLEVGIAR